jgi:cephalosporin hydroxylase
MEAVKEFLRDSPPFSVDHTREKYLMTHNPGGYLKRVR